MEWAEKIRYIKSELGIADKKGKLANLLGVRHGRISEIKNGKSKNPGADIVLLLINKLGVNPDWLDGEIQPIFLTPERLENQPLDGKISGERLEKQPNPLAFAPAGDGQVEAARQKPPGIPLVYEGDSGLEGGIIIPLLENAASAGYGAAYVKRVLLTPKEFVGKV
jgi:transcriptional regulator with XRE-family HTH domain